MSCPNGIPDCLGPIREDQCCEHCLLSEIKRLRAEIRSHTEWADEYGRTEAGKAILKNKALRARMEDVESFCVNVWQESALSRADRYIFYKVLGKLRGEG